MRSTSFRYMDLACIVSVTASMYSADKTMVKDVCPFLPTRVSLHLDRNLSLNMGRSVSDRHISLSVNRMWTWWSGQLASHQLRVINVTSYIFMSNCEQYIMTAGAVSSWFIGKLQWKWWAFRFLQQKTSLSTNASLFSSKHFLHSNITASPGILFGWFRSLDSPSLWSVPKNFQPPSNSEIFQSNNDLVFLDENVATSEHILIKQF